VNIGVSSYATGAFREAADAYRQAIPIDDNNAETQYSLGLVLNKLNRTDEEIVAYRRAIALRPDYVNAIERLGLALFRQKRFSEAAGAFDQLKNYKPDGKTYNYLGESLLEGGKFDESVEAFNTAVNSDPSLDKARYNLGRAYMKLNNRAMAEMQYDILRNSRSEYADRLFAVLNP